MEALNDKTIRFMYITLNMSGDKIANTLGCSKSAVCRHIKKMGITKPVTGHEGRNGKNGIVLINGYPALYEPKHPRAKSNGYVREHIVIMESLLGRSLDANEVVHHINGNKTDNHPENLMLFKNNAEHMRFHWLERHGTVRCTQSETK